jgi:AhpD family alkylhydroperoxidase
VSGQGRRVRCGRFRPSIREFAFRRQVRHVDAASPDRRPDNVVQQIRTDFGMVAPPFALHLPAPDLLSAFWMVFRESMYAGGVGRDVKEAVAVAVSAANACRYCVDVHTTMLAALGGGDPAIATDPALRGAVAWARASRQPEAQILRHRPFPDEHCPELVGTVVAFHYINRMMNIFGPDSPFPGRSPRAKQIARRIALPTLRKLLSRNVTPGASVRLLPGAEIPQDLAWAAGNPGIADAFARAAAAFDAAGREALPDSVRQLVECRLAAWHGEDPGISRAWVEAAVEPLQTIDRPLARVALLAAFASHQVDDQLLESARTGQGPAGDRILLAAAGWASFATARRIGTWLHP